MKNITQKIFYTLVFALALTSIANAQEHAKELYMYETTLAKGVSQGEVKKHFREHINYNAMLTEKGIMLAAGPLFDAPEAKSAKSSLVLIQASTFNEAKAIVDLDPLHVNGVRTYKLRKWLVKQGTMSQK